MRKKLLLLGGSGQLGQALYKQLFGLFDVYPTYFLNKSSLLENSINLDVSNKENVFEVIDNIKPDIIINTSALTNVEYCEKNNSHTNLINVIGMSNILNAISDKVNVVQISTDYVFSGFNGNNYKESSNCNPINYYGQSKLNAEKMLLASNNRYIIFRASTIFSNNFNCSSNFLTFIYKNLKNKKQVNIANDLYSKPTYVTTFAKTIISSILMDLHGIFHYGSSNRISKYDFAIEFSKVYNLDANLINSVSYKTLPFNAKRPKDSTLNTKKIQKKLCLDIETTNESLNSMKNG